MTLTTTLERRSKHRLFGHGLGPHALAVFFHQPGMRPQHIGTSSGLPSANLTTSIAVVGAML